MTCSPPASPARVWPCARASRSTCCAPGPCRTRRPARRSPRCSRAPRTCPSAGWTRRSTSSARSSRSTTRARATALVPADEAAAFGTALLPADDDGLKAIVGTAVPERDEGFAEPVELAVDAISDALDGVTLSRDDLHEELRQRLPGRAAAVVSRLPEPPRAARAARDGRAPRAAVHRRPRRAPAGVRAHGPAASAGTPPAAREAGAELVRRYLRGYGPSTPAHFAEWAGHRQARTRRELWALGDDCVRRRDDPRAGRGRAPARHRRPAAARPRPRARCSPTPRRASRCGRRSAAPASCSSTARRPRCGAPASRASGSRSASRGRSRSAPCRPRPSGSRRTAAAPRSTIDYA